MVIALVEDDKGLREGLFDVFVAEMPILCQYIL